MKINGFLKIIIPISFVACRFKVIYMNQTMSNFKNLCGSKYGKISNEMSLQSLSVFFRNGDRAPEDGRNIAWGKRMCINCDGSKCSLSHCRNGMLTIKGYKQGHDLAAFIKQEYYPKFHDKKIDIVNNKNSLTGILNSQIIPAAHNLDLPSLETSKTHNIHDNIHGAIFTSDFKHILEEPTPDIKVKGFYYSNNRSYAFLKSVVESIEYSSLDLQRIKSLNANKFCRDLRNSLFQKPGFDKLTPNGEFDRIVTSLCTDVPIDCEKFECDLMKMEAYLVQTMQSFEDDISKMREDFLSVAVDFAPLSTFLASVLKSSSDINLVSVTSETIISLLAGLNTSNQKLVQYGGAVFLELWKDKTGKEFFSVRYNDKHMEFGLFKEKFIEKTEFLKFLEMFSSYEKRIEKICKYKLYSTKRSEKLDHKKEELIKLFDPLMKKLHDRRILIK